MDWFDHLMFFCQHTITRRELTRAGVNSGNEQNGLGEEQFSTNNNNNNNGLIGYR